MIGDKSRVLKYDLLSRNSYTPQFKKEVFEIVPLFSRKPQTYIIKDEQGEIIRGSFYQKELINVI